MMNTAWRAAVLTPPPIIPPTLRPYCAAWWDAGKTNLADATKWVDYSGRGRNMTLYNFSGDATDGWNAGKPSYLQTDGINSYGKYAAAAISPVHTGFSMVFVGSVPNVTGYKYLFMATSSGSGSMGIYALNNTIYAWVRDSVTGTVQAGATVQAGKTYCLCAAYDQSTKKISLAVNGVFVATSAALSNGVLQTDSLKIGVRFDEAEFSNVSAVAASAFLKTLTADDVRTLYKNNQARLGITA